MQKEMKRLPKNIGYVLYLYFLGLSYRNTAKALSRFIKMSHVFQSGNGFNITTNQKEYLSKERRKISKFIIDQTQIKDGQDYFWIWVAVESTNKTNLGIHISSLERNIVLITEFFCIYMIKKQIWKTCNPNRR